MTEVTVELSEHQTNQIAFEHILNSLIKYKPYMDNVDMRKYKFMLCEFGSNSGLTHAWRMFDKAVPTDLKWGDI